MGHFNSEHENTSGMNIWCKSYRQIFLDGALGDLGLDGIGAASGDGPVLDLHVHCTCT